jgi:hypothetical protein
LKNVSESFRGALKSANPESTYIDFLCFSGFRIAAISAFTRVFDPPWRRPE